MIFQIQ